MLYEINEPHDFVGYTEDELVNFWIDLIWNWCNDIEAEDELNVYNFGANRDLKLYIVKDPDFKRDYCYNLVRIYTSKLNNGTLENVDDVEDISIDQELIEELMRIWNYQDFSLLF